MKPFVAVAAMVMIAAGCKRDADRRDDMTVMPPASVSTAASAESVGSAATASRDCGVQGTPLLTERGIGELQPGRSVSEVSALCQVIGDSRQRGAEGMMERVLVIGIGRDTVSATVNNDRVLRIEVSTSRIRTADSLGVDTPLRKISRKRGAQFAPGEDGVYGFVASHCGLRFHFSLPLRPPMGGQWTVKEIDAAHGDAVVDRVLVTKCEH